MSCNDPNVNEKSITENFLETIDKHAPLKKTFIRGNQHLSSIAIFRKQYALEPD